MRILQYNWLFPPHPLTGGRANICRYFSKFLALKGHEVIVLTTKCKGIPSQTFKDNFRVIRIGVYYSGNRFMDYVRKVIQQFIDYLWLRNNLKEFHIFHVHAPTYGVTFKTFWKKRYRAIFKGWIKAAKKVNVPVIVQFHGMMDEQNINLVENYLSDSSQADLIITVCHETRSKLIKLGLRKEIVVIPNGIDLELFNPEKYPQKERNDFVILYASGKNKAKGFTYLIEARNKLKKDIPNLKLILLGRGFKKVPYNKMPMYISRADVVVLPSLSEGFGLPLIEGMAMKKPVIGTNVGGIKEIIRNNETGFLVPPANVDKLAEAILTLYKNPRLRRNMGLKGRKLVEEKYDIRKIVSRIEQIYNKFYS